MKIYAGQRISVAAPPNTSMDVIIMFVINPKNKNTL